VGVIQQGYESVIVDMLWVILFGDQSNKRLVNTAYVNILLAEVLEKSDEILFDNIPTFLMKSPL
jgi:hypothetical protein